MESLTVLEISKKVLNNKTVWAQIFRKRRISPKFYVVDWHFFNVKNRENSDSGPRQISAQIKNRKSHNKLQIAYASRGRCEPLW